MGSVELTGLTKEYGDVIAVRDSNLAIEEGEFVTFVGPSGCGKSTTLQMIAGLTEPTAGSITIAEKDVTTLPPKDRDIAMVFQNIALFPHMSVEENISFGLDLRNFSQSEKDERVQRAVEILQVEGLKDRMPAELSGGQSQRVAIGRALVRDPEVFLMDEPLANLDAKLRVHMRTEIQRLHKELGTTTVYVTHDQEEAMTMSDRIVIMNEGEIQQVAPPLECYDRPTNTFVAGFIGSPSMNQISGRLVDSTFHSELMTLDLPEQQTEYLNGYDEITVGVRPEDIAFVAGESTLEAPLDSIEMTVDVLEPLGDEIYVYLLPRDHDGRGGLGAGDDSQLLASIEPDEDISEDDDVEVVFDAGDLHLFDANGEAIIHGYEPARREHEPAISD